MPPIVDKGVDYGHGYPRHRQYEHKPEVHHHGRGQYQHAAYHTAPPGHMVGVIPVLRVRKGPGGLYAHGVVVPELWHEVARTICIMPIRVI